MPGHDSDQDGGRRGSDPTLCCFACTCTIQTRTVEEPPDPELCDLFCPRGAIHASPAYDSDCLKRLLGRLKKFGTFLAQTRRVREAYTMKLIPPEQSPQPAGQSGFAFSAHPRHFV